MNVNFVVDQVVVSEQISCIGLNTSFVEEAVELVLVGEIESVIVSIIVVENDDFEVVVWIVIKDFIDMIPTIAD